jgi:hypothetical protein
VFLLLVVVLEGALELAAERRSRGQELRAALVLVSGDEDNAQPESSLPDQRHC